MGQFLRLFLRLFVVPAGLVAAVVAASLVAAFAYWGRFAGPGAADLTVPAILATAFMVSVQSFAFAGMLLPALVGVLVAEALAIRSILFHALNGGLSIWVGWTMLDGFWQHQAVFDDQKTVIAAGLAGGFAYWAVAGWSAGFWKPVRARPAAYPGTEKHPEAEMHR